MIAVVLFFSLFQAFAAGGADKGDTVSSKDGTDCFTLISLEPARRKAFPGAGNSADEILAAQLFTGVLEFDCESGLCAPALASQWVFSDDRLSCRLTPGEHLWSDGTPITASDIRSSWIHVLQSVTPASLFMSSLIKGGREFKTGLISEEELGLRIVNGNQIEIEFEQPCGPEILAAPAFYVYPPEIFSDPRSRRTYYGLTGEIRSSGAYELGSVKEGVIDLKLRAPAGRPETGGQRGAEDIRILIPDSREKALDLYRDQKADWLAPDAFPAPYIPDMEDRADYLEPAGVSSYFYILNADMGPLDSPGLRDLLVGSIDRTLLIEDLKGGPRLPAVSLLPPSLLQVDEASVSAESSAGLKSETVLLPEESLILICPDQTGHRLTAEALIRQWQEKTGLAIELRVMAARDFLEARKRGEFHLAPGGWLFTSPDPASLLFQFLPGGLYAGSGGSAFEEALLEMLRGEDKMRSELVKSAEGALVPGDSLILPLFFDSRPQLFRQAHWKAPELRSWFPPRLSRLHRF